MTSKERLDRINEILDSDDAFEADCVAGGLTAAKTNREKVYAVMLMDIYSVAHRASNCHACKDPESV